jgi:DNA mismatch repair protein MutS2
MKTVAEEKQALQEREIELTQKEQILVTTREEYQKISSELKARKKEIIDNAKTEAAYLLKETNREIEKTIRHIRENKAEKKETRKVRQSLQDLSEKVQPEIASIKTLPPGEIKEGDYVRIIGQEVSGRVLSLKGDSAVVQFGDLRSQVRISQLVRSDRAEVNPIIAKTWSMGFDLHKKQSEFTGTLDVRGKRVEEVIPLLEQFLDDAVLLSQGELKILHGKGEGVLRKVIRERLKETRHVASFGNAHIERGGDGITMVVLK